jgi:hypothetical protein
MHPIARDDLIQTITHAIWRAYRRTPKKGERMDEARHLARAVVDHLEFCEVECRAPIVGRGTEHHDGLVMRRRLPRVRRIFSAETPCFFTSCFSCSSPTPAPSSNSGPRDPRGH